MLLKKDDTIGAGMIPIFHASPHSLANTADVMEAWRGLLASGQNSLHIAYSLQPAAYSLQPCSPAALQPAAYSVAYGLLPMGYNRGLQPQPTAYSAAYGLRPTAYSVGYGLRATAMVYCLELWGYA